VVTCALEGTRPILLEIQALVSPSDLAMPRRVGTGVDPKRLAMIVAVLGRHAGVGLGQADVFVNVAGGVRIDEPGADLGIALAIASAARRSRARPRLGCFGEIGLTGKLRPAAQAERRLAECAKFGLGEAVVPAETVAQGDRGVKPGIRVAAVETLRDAIAVTLERGSGGTDEDVSHPRGDFVRPERVEREAWHAA
jgi:DNA repair protein RadA/Sms